MNVYTYQVELEAQVGLETLTVRYVTKAMDPHTAAAKAGGRAVKAVKDATIVSATVRLFKERTILMPVVDASEPRDAEPDRMEQR